MDLGMSWVEWYRMNITYGPFWLDVNLDLSISSPLVGISSSSPPCLLMST
jgi:hypothetical protein